MTLPIDNDARKALPVWDFLMEYFPDAILELVRVSVDGNKQHNPGERLHWAREKSTDQLNTAMRHQFDYGTGVKYDTDGRHHLAKAAWRLLAQVQLDLEKTQERWTFTQDKDVGVFRADHYQSVEHVGFGKANDMVFRNDPTTLPFGNTDAIGAIRQVRCDFEGAFGRCAKLRGHKGGHSL